MDHKAREIPQGPDFGPFLIIVALGSGMTLALWAGVWAEMRLYGDPARGIVWGVVAAIIVLIIFILASAEYERRMRRSLDVTDERIQELLDEGVEKGYIGPGYHPHRHDAQDDAAQVIAAIQEYEREHAR